eukprot:14863452-Alexandrium_andersonii.AAC.1
MSASLVGSEMCIRDRLRRELQNLSGWRLEWGAGRNGHRLLGSGLGFGTVSYTHLTLPTICSV